MQEHEEAYTQRKIHIRVTERDSCARQKALAQEEDRKKDHGGALTEQKIRVWVKERDQGARRYVDLQFVS